MQFVIDPYFGLNAANEALESIGCSAAWGNDITLIAFIWNIILLIFKKWTKLRTLLLTGHIMVQQATTVTWIVFLFIPYLRNITGAILVGMLVGTYQAVSSNLTVDACFQPYRRKRQICNWASADGCSMDHG